MIIKFLLELCLERDFFLLCLLRRQPSLMVVFLDQRINFFYGEELA